MGFPRTEGCVSPTTHLTAGSSVDDGWLKADFRCFVACRLFAGHDGDPCDSTITRLRGIAATTSTRAIWRVPHESWRRFQFRRRVRRVGSPRPAFRTKPLTKIRALRAVSWPQKRSCPPSCSLSSGLRPFASSSRCRSPWRRPLKSSALSVADRRTLASVRPISAFAPHLAGRLPVAPERNVHCFPPLLG